MIPRLSNAISADLRPRRCGPDDAELALKAAQRPDRNGHARVGGKPSLMNLRAAQRAQPRLAGPNNPAISRPWPAAFSMKQKPVLSEIFSPKEMESWASLMKSIDQRQPIDIGIENPRRSNTPQDILKALKNMSERGEHETLFSRLWKTALVSRELLEPTLGAVGFGHMAMPLGLVSAVGSHVLGGAP